MAVCDTFLGIVVCIGAVSAAEMFVGARSSAGASAPQRAGSTQDQWSLTPWVRCLELPCLPAPVGYILLPCSWREGLLLLRPLALNLEGDSVFLVACSYKEA